MTMTVVSDKRVCLSGGGGMMLHSYNSDKCVRCLLATPDRDGWRATDRYGSVPDRQRCKQRRTLVHRSTHSAAAATETDISNNALRATKATTPLVPFVVQLAQGPRDVRVSRNIVNWFTNIGNIPYEKACYRRITFKYTQGHHYCYILLARPCISSY